MSFAALAAAVAKVAQTEQALKAAQQEGERAAYAARNVRVEATANHYSSPIHDEGIACAEALKGVREEFAKGAGVRATEAAIARQIKTLENARATIPHLVAAAMIDLAGDIATLRRVKVLP